MEISFADQEEITILKDKLSLTETKLNPTGERLGFEHNLISSGAYGRDKEMSVNKFMQLWEYGYFVVQELDNVYTKNCGTAVDLTRHSNR
jgi:hypothetical protein